MPVGISYELKIIFRYPTDPLRHDFFLNLSFHPFSIAAIIDIVTRSNKIKTLYIAHLIISISAIIITYHKIFE